MMVESIVRLNSPHESHEGSLFDDDVDQAHLSGLDRIVTAQQQMISAGITAQRDLDRFEAFLDALGNADFTFAGQQFDRAHLAHVHAHRVGRAAELGVEIRQCRRRFLNGFLVRRGGRIGQQQGLGIRCLFVHRNTHVIDHVDDIFDLLGIDNLARQVVVHLGVGEVSLLLAAGHQ